MAEYAVETKDLTKQFGRIVALDKVNLHLTRGTVYGLVGKNGSGSHRNKRRCGYRNRRSNKCRIDTYILS